MRGTGRRLGIYVGKDSLDFGDMCCGNYTRVQPGSFVYYVDCTLTTSYEPRVCIWPIYNDDTNVAHIERFCKSYHGANEFVLPFEDIFKDHIKFECASPFFETNFDWIPLDFTGKIDYGSLHYRIHWLKYSSRRNGAVIVHDSQKIFDMLKYSRLSDTDLAYVIARYRDNVPVKINEDNFDKIVKPYMGVSDMYPYSLFKKSPEKVETSTVIFDSTEEKKMTETDKFMKVIDGITITSTRATLKAGRTYDCDIYYPKMHITPEIAEALIIVLLDMHNSYVQKVVFNPKEGYTYFTKSPASNMVSVKCHGDDFDFIKGYHIAKMKYYRGSDDYNWLNKITGHRKTHIEYTEPEKPKAKRGGKK